MRSIASESNTKEPNRTINLWRQLESTAGGANLGNDVSKRVVIFFEEGVSGEFRRGGNDS